MNLIADTHTHTIASGHAFATFTEMVQAAADRGLELLALTDHAPSIEGASKEIYFKNLRILPRQMLGVKLLLGSELNIMDYNGCVDLPEALLADLDICVASLHNNCITPGTAKENTQAVIGAMNNPYVAIIGHPDDSRFPLDYESIVDAAIRTNTLLEMNNSSLSKNSFRVNADQNYRKMLKICKDKGAAIALSTDSHFTDTVGVFTEALQILKEVDFPEELVVNTSVEKLISFIEKKRTVK